MTQQNTSTWTDLSGKLSPDGKIQGINRTYSKAVIGLYKDILYFSKEANLPLPTIRLDPTDNIFIYFFGGKPTADGGTSLHCAIVLYTDGQIAQLLRDRELDTTKVNDIEANTHSLRKAISGIWKFLAIDEYEEI